MPYYHATHMKRLDAIYKEGLHSRAKQNFDCKKGVYLALDPYIAFGFLLEDFFAKADEQAKPSQEAKNFLVIVIDDARINPDLLHPDPNVEGKWQKELFIYGGEIDITAMPIINSEILFSKEQKQKNNNM